MEDIFLIKMKVRNLYRRNIFAEVLNFRKVNTAIIFTLVFSGCAGIFPNKSKPAIDVEKRYSKSELTEDLDFLFQTYKDVHPNLYMYTQKNVIDSMVTIVKDELKHPMTSLEFWTSVTPIVAKLGDGHTFLNFPYSVRRNYLDNGGKIFPLEIRIDGNQIVVRKNYTSDTTLAVNSELLSINGLPQEIMLQDLRRYRGGETIGLVNRYVQRMFKPLLWAHYGFEDHFKVEYISSTDGEHYKKTLLGITSEEYNSFFQNKKKIKQKPTYWTFQSILDEKTGILDLNSFARPKDLKSFKKFLKSTFTTIHNEGLNNLIIDVRRNGGGEHTLGEALIDYLATEPWVMMSKAEVRLSPQMKEAVFPWILRWLPIKSAIKVFSFLYSATGIDRVDIVSESNNVDILTAYTKPKKLKKNPLRFHGNTFVLIDNGSYSMSVIFAAVMKDYHFATIIGEETGQPANPYGGNYFFSLPNTQLRTSVSTGRTYRPSGQDTDRGVLPDYEVKQTHEDREKGIDTVMEFTKELIKKNEEIGVMD